MRGANCVDERNDGLTRTMDSDFAAEPEAAAKLGRTVAVLAATGRWDQARGVIAEAQAAAIRAARGPRKPSLRDLVELPLADLGLPLRTTNLLERNGVLLLRELLALPLEELLRIHELGPTTAYDLLVRLGELGFDVSAALATVAQRAERSAREYQRYQKRKHRKCSRAAIDSRP